MQSVMFRRLSFVLLTILVGVTTSLCLIMYLNHCLVRYISCGPLFTRRYKKSAYKSQDVQIAADAYHYSYTFKDHRNQLLTWTWKNDKKTTDRFIATYGISPLFFRPYRNIPSVVKQRRRILYLGMFKKTRGCIRPDHSKVAVASMPMTYPLYDHLEKTVTQKKLSFRDTIELVMKFCQDIPYGIPPKYYNGRYIGGLFPPPLCLNKKYGDCDTKAVLLASILAFNPKYEIVFIDVSGHLMIGIAGVPRPYDKYVTHLGKNWIYCEPVGPGRIPFGISASPYDKIERIDRLRGTDVKRKSVLRKLRPNGNN